MATGLSIAGEWSETQQKLAGVAIGSMLAFLGDLLWGNGFFASTFALAAYAGAALSLSATTALAVLPRHQRSKPSDNAMLAIMVGVVATMRVFSWQWIALAGFVMAFVNRETAAARRFRDWGWYYIGTLAVVVLLQLWLNTAAINTMGSDEDMLGNKVIEELAPMLAALGFAVFMMRVVPARGTQVIAVFFVSAMAFHHLQTQAVEWWAERQPSELQRTATLASYGKVAMLNQGVGLLTRDVNANPRFIRLLSSFLPARAVVHGDTNVLQRALSSANAEMVLGGIQHEMLHTNRVRREGMHALRNVRAGYEGYMAAFMLRMDNEQTAQNLARQQYPGVLDGRDEPLTRSALAEHIIREINAEVPANRRNMNGYRAIYNSGRGRQRIINGLREVGVSLPSDWSFTTFEAFKSDIERGLLRHANNLERRATRHLSGTPSSLASLQVGGARFMSWDDYTQKGLGLHLPRGSNSSERYTAQQYEADVRALFANSSAQGVLERGLPAILQGETRTLPVKAAVLPAMVIVSSFLVLIANAFALASALYERFGWRLKQHLPVGIRYEFDKWLKIGSRSLLGGVSGDT